MADNNQRTYEDYWLGVINNASWENAKKAAAGFVEGIPSALSIASPSAPYAPVIAKTSWMPKYIKDLAKADPGIPALKGAVKHYAQYGKGASPTNLAPIASNVAEHFYQDPYATILDAAPLVDAIGGGFRGGAGMAERAGMPGMAERAGMPGMASALRTGAKVASYYPDPVKWGAAALGKAPAFVAAAKAKPSYYSLYKPGGQTRLSPEAFQAISDAGIDPKLFGDKGLQGTWAGIAKDKGVSAATAREAVLRHAGVQTPTRGTTMREAPPTGVDTEGHLTQARADVAAQQRRKFGDVQTGPRAPTPLPTPASPAPPAPPVNIAGLGKFTHDPASGQWKNATGATVSNPSLITQIEAQAALQAPPPPPAPPPAPAPAASGIHYDDMKPSQRRQYDIHQTALDMLGRQDLGPSTAGGSPSRLAQALPGAVGVGAGALSNALLYSHLGPFAYPLSAAVGALAGKGEAALQRRLMPDTSATAELAGAPVTPPTTPDLSGVGTGLNVARMTTLQPMQDKEPAPSDELPGLHPGEYGQVYTADDLARMSKPHAAGGRANYKSGGSVGHVEPLVRDLMNRYKKAKRDEEAGSKSLLNHSDDAIVKALNVAKDAI